MIELTKIYQKIISEKGHVNLAVDMTAGNGHDTLFLSEHANLVYAFDIQKEAIENTSKLISHKNNVKLIHDNHENVLKYIDQDIDLAIYNLGYLPGSSKEVMTNCSSTINSLKDLLQILNNQGIIILEIYPHNQEESRKLQEFAKKLNPPFYVAKLDLFNMKNPPYLIIITKKEKR